MLFRFYDFYVEMRCKSYLSKNRSGKNEIASYKNNVWILFQSYTRYNQNIRKNMPRCRTFCTIAFLLDKPIVHLHVSKQITFSARFIAAEGASEAGILSALHVSMILKRTPSPIGLAAGFAVILRERGRTRVVSVIIICENTRETKYDC